jgi:hypothetical protein
MSHFTKIRTKITDRKSLIEALQNLNYNVEENVSIIGYQGAHQLGDVVVKTSGGYDIGFVKNSDQIYEMWGKYRKNIPQLRSSIP